MNSVAKVGCETFLVRFDGFEDLPAMKGESFTESPDFSCFGHQWCIRVYPGGDSTSRNGKVAAYICYKSDDDIKVQIKLTVSAKCRTVAAAYENLKPHKFRPSHEGAIHNFADRSRIIRALQDGALVIDVQMTQTEPSTQPFVPANPLLKSILKKFMDEESADVMFEVSSDQEEGARKKKKRAKATPTAFHAHRFIIEESAPALGEACNLKEGMDPVHITGVRPEIFKLALYYAYGGEVDNEDMSENTKEILEAADRFGIAGLKLAAEACYVKATEITIENVLDNLVYADAKNCALLKEAVMDFIVENGAEVMKKVPLKDVPEGLFGDLLAAVSRGKKNEAGKSGEDVHMMRVSELRRKLDEKGLNVDGSREAMIAALEGSL